MSPYSALAESWPLLVAALRHGRVGIDIWPQGVMQAFEGEDALEVGCFRNAIDAVTASPGGDTTSCIDEVKPIDV